MRTAVLIGVNNFDSNPGMPVDIGKITTLLKRAGVGGTAIKNFVHPAEVTKANIVNYLTALSGHLQPGDRLYLYFSGHGHQFTDEGMDEADGKDESIILYNDEHILDDELFDIFTGFNAGVQIVFIADCCNSGTLPMIAKGPKVLNIAFRKPTKQRLLLKKIDAALKAELIYLGAAADTGGTIPNPNGSVFTRHLVDAFNRFPNFTLYQGLMWTKKKLSALQSPSYLEISATGKCSAVDNCTCINANFRNEVAFP